MVPSSADGRSSGCRVWNSALCSAVCQSLGQTWCQDEDHKHLPHVPQSCTQQRSLQSFMGFSPTPSLPLPRHIFLCSETTGVSKLSLLSLGRWVWEGPPARFEHKVTFEHLTRHTAFGFFSCSGLGALPWLPWREAHTAAGAARLGSTARVMELNSIAGKCEEYWGNRTWNLCHLHSHCCCRALRAPLVLDAVRSFSKDVLQRDGKSCQEFHSDAKARETWGVLCGLVLLKHPLPSQPLPYLSLPAFT